jgi:tetratricopeptide (TPR) repeat protein
MVERFELLERIGSGGMGHVWLARCGAQRLAVKVLTSERALLPAFRKRFREEARAVARLDHPSIIRVMDYGEARIAVAGQRAPREASPYLAMEWMPGGTLDDVRQFRRWAPLRRVLLRLLDALAYAHARGVLHRDLKPSNILLDPVGDGAFRVVLADFGVARTRRDQGEVDADELLTGTPGYMAPEQIRGGWRNEGPWTDLFALGCLTHRLVTGRRPFAGRDIADTLQRQLFAPPPELVGEAELPVGFAGWVQRLLAKRIADRFQHAADAAYQLTRIAGAPDADSVADFTTGDAAFAEAQGSRAIADAEHRPRARPGGTTVTLPSTQWERPLGSGGRPDACGPPPIPRDWRAAGTPADRAPAVALGLFGFRSIPLVGRDRERDALWNALRKVRATGAAHAVVLHGVGGVGKSRLAGWLAERAGEVGAATVLRATHNPVGVGSSALARMLADYTRCSRLAFEDAREHLRTAFDTASEYELSAAIALMFPERGEGIPRFATPGERYDAFALVLERIAADRVPLVWLEDAHWSAEAVALTLHLIDPNRRPAPALVVLTMRDDLAEGTRIRDLVERERVVDLPIPALTPAEHSQLVGSMLTLERELAAQVGQRTHGNPLFAVQLVADWVERGILIARGDGFSLAPNASVTVPPSIQEFWGGRTAHFVDAMHEHRADEIRTMLEVAAALGQEVDADEWRRACARAGPAIPDRFVDVLCGQALAVEREHGWAFIHGMLRESVEHEAVTRGSWRDVNRSCAESLGEPANPASAESNERIGRHWAAADQPERAVAPLLRAARQLITTSDYERVEVLLDDRRRLLERMDVAIDDARSVQGELCAAHAHAKNGRLAQCERALQSVHALFACGGPSELRAEAHWLSGFLANKRGEIAAGLASFEQARALYEQVDDRRGEARCLHGVAQLECVAGNLAAAVQSYRAAIASFEKLGDRGELAVAESGLSDTYRRLREMPLALEFNERALDRLRVSGNRGNLAATVNNRGDILRALGRLDGAERQYRAALGMFDELGSRDIAIPRMNLAAVLIDKRRFGEARGAVDRAAEEFAEQGRRGYLPFVHAYRLACASGARDWNEASAHCGALVAALGETPIADEDLAASLEGSARRCAAAGELALAVELYRHASRQLRQLGRIAEADRAASCSAALARR